MALASSRKGHIGRSPTGEMGGRSGSSTAHSASVTSLAKRSPSRICCARVVAVHMGLFIQLGRDCPETGGHAAFAHCGPWLGSGSNR
jgi:hypothetical protein